MSDLFDDIESQLAHADKEARSNLVDVVVCLHKDTGRNRNGAILVSMDGDEFHAEWIPHSRLTSFEPRSATKRGTTKRGQAVDLPLAMITLPSVLAAQKRLV